MKNETAFITQNLYDYQIKVVELTDTHNIGKVIMPTGTGKTFVQAAIIARDIVMNSGKRLYVVNAPRITLSYQLMKEIYTFLTKRGIFARYMSVHSGGPESAKELEDIRVEANQLLGENTIDAADTDAGTSPNKIKEFISNAGDAPVILFSTYHSADRIQTAIQDTNINILVNDEAHYLVQERFFEILNILKFERCYFFTATEIHTDSESGRGMNNMEKYGKTIFKMTPREAIEMGKMLRPRMHFITTSEKFKYNMEDVESNIPHIIEAAFNQHRFILGGTINPKLLVSARGVGDIKKFMESKEYAKLIKIGVKIFCIASDDRIGNDVNGIKMNRREFLNTMKSIGENPAESMIILHYDTIAEGISINGITAIMPLRELTKSKFLQTFGRAARLDGDDRAAIERCEISHNDLDKMNKPYAWVLIPNIIHEHSDNKDKIGSLITDLREFDFNPTEHIVITDATRGLKPKTGLEGLNHVKKVSPKLGEEIENLEAQYEDERFASLSTSEAWDEWFKD